MQGSTQADKVERVAEEIARIAEGRVVATGESPFSGGYFAIETDYAGECIDVAENNGYKVYTVNVGPNGKAEIKFEQRD